MTKSSDARRQRRLKAKGTKPKERTTSIIFSVNPQKDELSFFYDPATDSISFDEQVGYARLEARYDRPKGEKVVNSLPRAANGSVFFDHGDHLRNSFDRVVSVDTNYQKIGDEIIAITGVLLWWSDYDNHYACKLPFLFETTNPKLSPEKMGWAIACDHLLKESVVDAGQRIGVIVDAHLGDIEAINERRIPLLTDIMLHPCFTLIYASADTGGDLLVNRMLKETDKVSASFLAQIKSGEVAPNARRNGKPEFCSGFRIIRPLPSGTGDREDPGDPA